MEATLRFISVFLTFLLLAVFPYSGFPVTQESQATHVVIVGPKTDPKAKILYTTATTALSSQHAHIEWWDRKRDLY